QTAMFDSPIPIAADTDYMVAYRAPAGHYSLTPGAFSGTGVQRAPLYTAADSGAYSYTGGYPSATTSTSYYVDVVFTRPAVPLSVVSQVPAADDLGVAVDSPVTLTMNSALASGASLSLSGPGGAVSGTSALSSDGLTLTFTPGAALAQDTTYTATATGLVNTDGSTLADQTWSFTTVTADGCPCGLFSTETPATAAAADNDGVELGVSFVPAADGLVSGVRFYKGTGNGGTHTGTLWSATGTALATVTFTGETASGWQTAMFASPVAVTAGTTYVVSYYAPQGHYAVTSDYFTVDHTVGPLTAPAAGNGRYVYGGGFPTSSWRSTNYFVDVVYEHGSLPAPSVTSTSPANGATGVATSATVTAMLSGGASGTPELALASPAGAVSGTSSFSTATNTLTFTPSAALPAGTTLTATASLAGTPLTGGTWSFTTAAAPVTVTSRSPASGATGVSTSATVSAVLSAAPASGTPSLALSDASGAVAGTSSWNATSLTVTFTPSSTLADGTAYTATVTADGGTPSGGSWTFTTAPAGPTSYSIWSDTTVPDTASWNDPDAVQVGTRFQTDTAGSVVAIRFYKGAANTGTHTVMLWDSSGTLLAQAQSTGETASGWQTVTFATPVAITPGTVYTASYYTTSGMYAASLNALASPVTNGPLSTAGGAYVYGTSFPANTVSHWYGVDVVLQTTG
ncbi:MAG: DUF4082 domain-containing protein, partial [Actinomycetales bacterium]|nr:DUF4082 domain-containing protein [Actinomycetales bacterium]